MRVRFALGMALLAAISVIAVATSNYLQTSDRLHDQVDSLLVSDARPLIPPAAPRGLVATSVCQQISSASGSTTGYVAKVTAVQGTSLQCLDANGRVTGWVGKVNLPVSGRDAQQTRTGPRVTGQEFRGNEYRVVTVSTAAGQKIRIARNLASTEAVLASIRDRSALIGAIVIVLAAIAGWLLARRTARPVEQLTRVAEQVAVTGELDQPVLTSRHDEVGRLARAFSSMLAALRQSRTQQQQLVEDASHELRTPLTSMSTNIDTLRRHQDLNPEVRDRVLASLAAEVKALRSLTNELVELTMSARIQEVEGVIDLDVLVQRAVAIVAQRSGRQFDVDATPSTVVGRPEGLLRAIVNVLDNATKFSPAPSPIEVTMRDGRVVVRDHGAGIAARDLSHVFDRFYRAVEARSQPGSGLGLAIVRDVVEACGGEVTVANHVDGGAVFSIQLPMISAESEQEHPHPSNR